MLSRECWRAIGGMDLRTFGRYGWGIDLDLALRARNAGYGLYITEMAYINHFGSKTANARFGRWRYDFGAYLAMVRGLRRLHGWGATFVIMRESGPAHQRKWREHFPLDHATPQIAN
jgi:GT2 family glycosyltransferase